MSEAVFIDARRPAAARIGSLNFADCERIRHSRDAVFDDLIFIAVLTTGIYCRPVCPVRQPLSKNVRYYSSAAMRVQRAKRLIDATTLPMMEIAGRAGFASIRSFNASFREVYRCAPSELRRQAQRSPPPPDGEPLYEIGSCPDTQSKLL